MMNHDGSQQYTFGYGLATTPQIQQLQQQQQQIQIQQHHFQRQQTQQQHTQILQQHQGNPAASIPAQNVFQLQVGGNPAATALLQQQSDNTAAASPTIVQHAGLISQPVIHASISVSLENSINKPLQVQCLNNSMDAAMVYPQPQHQSNGLKIITNSGGSFIQQQQQPEIHFQSLATADNLGNSATGAGIFDGNGGVGAAFGKQFSGWVHGDVGSAGNQQQQYNVGQNATLPSFGHLWSQFQQQKTQVNIIQQQQQQQQPMQVHQFQSPHIAQHAPGQFTVSGMQSVNNIQMIKVQQAPNALQDHTVLQSATQGAPLFQSCATPVQQNMLLTAQHTCNSSPLPQITCLSSPLSSISQSSASTVVSTDPTRNLNHSGITVGQVGSVLPGVSLQTESSLVSAKKTSKSVQRKLKSSSHDAQSSSPCNVARISSSTDNTVRIRPSNRKALSESGPPKVTVTLDSLPSTNNLSQFPEKTDSLKHMKATAAEKGIKFSPRNQHGSSIGKFERNQAPLTWQYQSRNVGSPERKKLIASNHLTSSTGSSLDRPSSEDSNFSSPPYSFTPPSSIDSVFSPPPLKDTTRLAALNSADNFPPTLPSSSSVKSTAMSSPPPSITAPSTNFSSSFETVCNNNNSHLPQTSYLNSNNSESQSSNQDNDSVLASSNSPSPSFSQTSMFTTSLVSASCCSIAITTTSVTSSSPRTNKGDIAVAASVHSLSPLSSPGISSKSKKANNRIEGGLNKTDHHRKQVRVPYSWQRNLDDGVVVYLSPSGAVLTSLDEIRDYLLSHDTCKCGLECPFQLEDVFVFDPAIDSMPWCKVVGNNGVDSPMGNLCNHRREILAMAAFHQSQTHARQVLSETDNVKGRKREGRRSFSAGDDFVISPLKKLRTSITNAVNRHALLRTNNSSPASNNSNLPSPMSELENLWQKDDDVFFPISSSLNNVADRIDSLHNAEESYPSPMISEFSCNKMLKDDERQKFLNNSENLVYSNHHPSQRLGSKGHHSHHHDHCQQNIPLPLHKRHNSPSSTFSPRNVGDAFLYHHQSSSPHQNQKNIGSLLHNNNNCDTVDKEREALSLASSPNLLSYNDDNSDSNSEVFAQQDGTQITGPGINNTSLRSSKSATDEQRHHIAKDDSEDKNDFHLLPLPPSSLSTVSFFENPTMFVAQQTAMINSSISSCNINSPSPGFLDDSVTLVERKDNDDEKIVHKKSSAFLAFEEEEDGDDENNLDTSREDDEEHKANTDLESNKSFSDTTENNDSAYLSQTGSDQEKSDTVDGLDCLSKSSDVYDFNTSEDQLGSVSVSGGKLRNSLSDHSSGFIENGVDVSVYKLCEAQLLDNEVGKEKFVSPSKGSGSKLPKMKQNRTAVSKKKSVTVPGLMANNCLLDSAQNALSSLSNPPLFNNDNSGVENFDTNNIGSTGSLNRDLSQLLASNNWNIPALQKVLAQHSAGDPEHLRQVIQQMMTQITTPNNPSCQATESPVCSLNTNNTASNVAATFVSDGTKKVLKQEESSDQSVSGSDDKNDVPVSSSNVKTLQDFGKQKSIAQASKVGDKINHQIGGQGSGDIIVSSASTKTNASAKQEPMTKASPTYNNHKGLTQSANVNVSNVASVSAAKTMTLSSPSTAPAQTQPPQSCSSLQTSMILSAVKPQTAQLMSLSSNNSPTTTTVINVSKPLQMAQVIPNNLSGINQATTVLPTQQFLGTCTTPAQQLLNPHHQHPSSQNSPQQQIMNMNMNSLSLPGLSNQQLFISNNPIQQASPSSVAAAQLSPAMAAAAGQILAAQTQQHQQSALQQQMSPSFLPAAHLSKSCSASISSLAIPNNTPAIPIAAGSNATGVADVSGSISQGPTALAGNVLAGAPQNSAAVVAAANASVYSAATNQPVFVIPQAKAVQPPPPPPVVQLVGGSSQTLNPAANGLQPGEVNMNQILSQISADQSQQIQNLINAASAGGFNPTAAAATLGGMQQQQSAWSTVNLSTQQQQQQQQQLQLLQLQQLMLPTVIGNQTQTLPNASMCCPTQTTSLMVGQQGLQINQVVDVKTIQHNLTPAAAQGFNNHGLPSVAAQTAFSNQIQQMASPLTVQVGSAATNQTIPTINPQVSLSKSINIIQHQQPLQQQALQTCPPSVIDPAVKKNKPPSVSAVTVSNVNIAAQATQTIATNNKNGDKEIINTPSQAQPQQLSTASTAKSPVVVSNNSNSVVLTKSTSTTVPKPNSKSKSKSKKSDSTKVKDPQTAKDEEHIANAVNQILAQAVQQQRELTLAAQNAPPPPPKSRNRKRDSQARARQAAAAQAAAAAALQQAKEQELGKIASISDDAVFHHPLQPPKALPTYTSPVPIHNLSNGSSPLSSSSSSLSSPSSFSPTTVMNRQEPPSQSLSHLVSNDNKNATNSSVNQFAIFSSQSSNNVVLRPTASPSLPPPPPSSSLLSTSESIIVHSAPSPLADDPSSSQLSSTKLTFMSTPSSTVVAAVSPSSSKATTASNIRHPHQLAAQHKSPNDLSSFDSQVDNNHPANRTVGGRTSKSAFGNNNIDNGKNKNATTPSLLPAAASTINNNSAAMFQKSPSSMNPIGVVSSSKSVSLSSSTLSAGTTPKKNSISLKEHLSSIVFSKDKESGKKKCTTTRSGSSNDKVKSSNTAASLMNQSQGSTADKSAKSNNNVNENNTTATPNIASLNFNNNNNNNSKFAAKVSRPVVNGENVSSSKGSRQVATNKNV